MTEDPSALRRWMIACPEVSQLVAQYEIASEAKEIVAHTYQHEQTPKAQQGFLERVDKLSQVFTDTGNPFKEESRDLSSLDTNSIAHLGGAELIFTHHARGITRFVEFMDGLESEVSPFYEPITKTRVHFFRQEQICVNVTKQKVLKDDCQLFSKLLISCQTKENATCMTSFVTRITHSLIGGQQSQHCIVAHTSGSNLQLAAETCEFSRKFHRCPWDFNVHYPHFY